MFAIEIVGFGVRRVHGMMRKISSCRRIWICRAQRCSRLASGTQGNDNKESRSIWRLAKWTTAWGSLRVE